MSLSAALNAEALRTVVESDSTDVSVAIAKALFAMAGRIAAAEARPFAPTCKVFAGFVGGSADDFAGPGEIRRGG